MRKNILETYRLLVELRNEKSIPDRHEKEADRCIFHLEEILNNERVIKINKGIIATIFALLKEYFSSPP